MNRIVGSCWGMGVYRSTLTWTWCQGRSKTRSPLKGLVPLCSFFHLLCCYLTCFLAIFEFWIFFSTFSEWSTLSLNAAPKTMFAINTFSPCWDWLDVPTQRRLHFSAFADVQFELYKNRAYGASATSTSTGHEESFLCKFEVSFRPLKNLFQVFLFACFFLCGCFIFIFRIFLS